MYKINIHPYYIYKDIIGFIIVLIIFTIIVLFRPNILGEPENFIPANPLSTPLHIKPEWYFYPVFRLLKITNLFWGVIIPMIFFGLLFFWPFVDRLFEKLFPKKEVALWIGVLGAITICVFLVWEALAH